jgi:hypothetical protein
MPESPAACLPCHAHNGPYERDRREPDATYLCVANTRIALMRRRGREARSNGSDSAQWLCALGSCMPVESGVSWKRDEMMTPASKAP